MDLSPVFPLREESNEFAAESPPKPEPIPLSEILNGVVAFVEVRSQAENRSQAISQELQQLGAAVSNRLNSTITHVIFREGRKRTKDWAERHSIPLVSVGWIQSCKQKQCRVSESGYEVMYNDSGSDEASPITGIFVRRRLRSMQPKELDEELKLSAERKKRAARRNAKRIALHRQVQEVEDRLKSLENGSTNDYYANPCIRVPQTPPSMKEFAERIEKKKDSFDSESPSTRSSPSAGSVRRRLFSNSVGQEDIENMGRSRSPRRLSTSSPKNRYMLEDTVNCNTPSATRPGSAVKPVRKLFNANAFEATGKIIEPQHSSNRLQDISKVFPKSFRKRNIIPLSKEHGIKRKRLSEIEYQDTSSDIEDDETNYEEMNFSTITKSRRLSAQRIDVDKENVTDSIKTQNHNREQLSKNPLTSQSLNSSGSGAIMMAGKEELAEEDTRSSSASSKEGTKHVVEHQQHLPGIEEERNKKDYSSKIDEIHPSSASRSASSTPHSEDRETSVNKSFSNRVSNLFKSDGTATEGKQETAKEKISTSDASHRLSYSSNGSRYSKEYYSETNFSIITKSRRSCGRKSDISLEIESTKGKKQRSKSLSSNQSLTNHESEAHELEENEANNPLFSKGENRSSEMDRSTCKHKPSKKPISDVLEVIDEAEKQRNFIKAKGCSSFVRRKSVRFSDVQEDSDGSVFHLQSPVYEKSCKSIENADDSSVTPASIIPEIETLKIQSSPNVRRSQALFVNVRKNRSNIEESRNSKQVNEESEEDEEACDIGILIDAIKKVKTRPELLEISSTTATDTSNRRRSSRISENRQQVNESKIKGNDQSALECSTSSNGRTTISQSSLTTDNESSVDQKSLRGSSRGSIDGQRRLRYSYESSTGDLEPEEEVFGVLIPNTPEQKKMKQIKATKRVSMASVLKALTDSPDTSKKETPSRKVRPSLDDFQLSKNRSGSSQSRSISRLQFPSQLSQSSERISRGKKVIVFTSLHKDEQELAKNAVMALGNGKINPNVNPSTTHVVTNWPIRRTLNLLRGVIFGCHIVALPWLIESREAGNWLSEDEYRVNAVPTPDKSPSMRKLFSPFKSIYVDNGVTPPQKELKSLVQLAGGKIDESLSLSPRDAAVVISSQRSASNCVSPKWILDSIMESEALPLEEYKAT